MRLAIDIDDVLADFQKEFLKFYNKKDGTKLHFDDVYTYDYTELTNKPWSYIKNLIFEFYDSFEFANLGMVKDSLSGVTKLGNDHELYIITARPKSTEAVTVNWLDKKYGDIFEDVLLIDKVNNPNVRKSDFCRDLKINAIVEDSPKEVQNYIRGDVFIHLLDKPWNRSIKDVEGMKRCDGWKDVVIGR
jgi:5'(3')-deoxyribonucleotidase